MIKFVHKIYSVFIRYTNNMSDWLQLDNLDAANDATILMPVPNTTPTLIKSYTGGTVIEMNVANHAGSAGNTVYLFGLLY